MTHSSLRPVVVAITFALGFAVSGAAQADLAGTWKGSVQTPGGKLEIIVRLEQAGDAGWTGEIDIPAQRLEGRKLVDVKREGDDVAFRIEKIPGDPREHRGRTSLDLPEGATLQQLLDHFEISRKMSQMVLVNGQQVSRESADRRALVLGDGDVVSVFPPLAGG